jgi:pimeloyl-ACP methyl ester carboxylesterase
MSRPLYRQRWAWVEGIRTVRREAIPDAESADFALSTLADRGLLTTRQLADFQDATGLADFSWRTFWSRTALEKADGNFRSLMRRTQGFVIFMHGWDGSGEVWEHLPALTCAANSRLVALAPDLNGFGGSPFLAEVPALEQCDPHAVMQSVVYWAHMLGLRSSERARRRRRVITFVGHSTGGAALFYFPEQDWHDNEYARCAVAPALLIDAHLREGFYQALGVGLWTGKSAEALEKIKLRLTPRVVENLVDGASNVTRAEHLVTFEQMSQGTLAQTFYAIGVAPNGLISERRNNFRVILARDDRMVDVSQMLNLLYDIGFASNQIQVVWGDHYLFSVGDQSRRVHLRNREVVLGAVLHLHELCRERQESQ